MSANIAVLRLWRKNNLIALWKIQDIFQIQRTVCISAQQRFLLSENKLVAATATITTTNKKLNWNKAISEAEKIVGYPTSFLSLKWLLSDEIANIAFHLRKLVGSNHPLLKTAKNIIFNGHNNVQAFGLIVLLISKAAGHLNVNHIEEDKSAGVLHSQRTLAGIVEMIHIGNLIHKGIVNLDLDGSLASERDNMLFGNKIALLCGDYFLSSSCVESATLKNQHVLFLIASIVADLSQAEFIARRDNQGNPIPSIPPNDRTGYGLKEWELLHMYDAGSLLGKGCQSTLSLAGHSNEIQQEGRKFGQHLSLALQAYLDLTLCINKDKAILHNLCAAPIMFHVEHDPSILVELDKGLKSVENVDYLKVLEIVTAGPGIELTKELIKEHSRKTMEVLNVFEENDAKKALSNIIAAIGDF